MLVCTKSWERACPSSVGRNWTGGCRQQPVQDPWASARVDQETQRRRGKPAGGLIDSRQSKRKEKNKTKTSNRQSHVWGSRFTRCAPAWWTRFLITKICKPDLCHKPLLTCTNQAQPFPYPLSLLNTNKLSSTATPFCNHSPTS